MLFLLCIRGQFSKYESPGPAYIRRGDLTEGFFALPGLGGLYLEGLIHGRTYFRILLYMAKGTKKQNKAKQPNAIKQTKSKKQNETKQNNTKINCRP